MMEKTQKKPELIEVPINNSDMVEVIDDIANYLLDLSCRKDTPGGEEKLLTHLNGYAKGLKVMVSKKVWFLPTENIK